MNLCTFCPASEVIDLRQETGIDAVTCRLLIAEENVREKLATIDSDNPCWNALIDILDFVKGELQ